MNIAISASGTNPGDGVDPRFGRAPFFVLYDSETASYRAIDNKQNTEAMQGAGIQAAETIVREQAVVLLTGHCGPKAFRVLQAAGVRVYTGLEGTVEEAVELFTRGGLEEASAPDVEGHWM